MTNSYDVYINKLPLPQGLLDLIDSGRWQSPADQSKVDLVFPERGELRLYSLGYMPFENERWINETNPVFFGVPDDANPPGDIDPHQSVLIGDLGTGYDQPIALDYRLSLQEPRVLTLKWSQSGRSNRWVEIAPDIRTFGEMLGL
jgi:hypothetical protein